MPEIAGLRKPINVIACLREAVTQEFAKASMMWNDANRYDLGSMDGAMTLLYCRLAQNTEHAELNQQCNHA